jgi:hypothetical protein
MEVTAYSLWTMVHGMGFGALYLLACSEVLVESLSSNVPFPIRANSGSGKTPLTFTHDGGPGRGDSTDRDPRRLSVVSPRSSCGNDGLGSVPSTAVAGEPIKKRMAFIKPVAKPVYAVGHETDLMPNVSRTGGRFVSRQRSRWSVTGAGRAKPCPCFFR